MKIKENGLDQMAKVAKEHGMTYGQLQSKLYFMGLESSQCEKLWGGREMRSPLEKSIKSGVAKLRFCRDIKCEHHYECMKINRERGKRGLEKMCMTQEG